LIIFMSALKNLVYNFKSYLAGRRTARAFKSTILVEEDKDASLKTEPNKLVAEFTDNFLCRICQDMGDPDQEVCIPCECAGSMKYVHTNCLKEWMRQKASLQCEICHKPYTNKWKIWAYENQIVKIKSDNDNSVNNSSNIWIKLIPLLIFSFLLFGMVVFALNNRGMRFTNKYYVLVQYFRWTLYGALYLIIFSTMYYFKTYCTFEEQEQDFVAELKKKIARFVQPEQHVEIISFH